MREVLDRRDGAEQIFFGWAGGFAVAAFIGFIQGTLDAIEHSDPQPSTPIQRWLLTAVFGSVNIDSRGGAVW
jgi:hypothetical protein